MEQPTVWIVSEESSLTEQITYKVCHTYERAREIMLTKAREAYELAKQHERAINEADAGYIQVDGEWKIRYDTVHTEYIARERIRLNQFERSPETKYKTPLSILKMTQATIE